jgi:hypothetical protein
MTTKAGADPRPAETIQKQVIGREVRKLEVELEAEVRSRGEGITSVLYRG